MAIWNEVVIMNLLQMSFTGAVMILAVTVIRALAINKVPKKTFLVLWGITLVRLMIPFSLPSWFSIYSLWNREMPTEGMNTAAGMLIPVIPAEHQATIPHNTVGPVANVSAPEIIWILGCVLCAFFFAAAYWKSYKEFQCPCLSEMMGLRSGWKLIQQNEPLPCANPVWYLLH